MVLRDHYLVLGWSEKMAHIIQEVREPCLARQLDVYQYQLDEEITFFKIIYSQ